MYSKTNNWMDELGGEREVLLTTLVTSFYNRKCSFSFKISKEFVSDWLDKSMTWVEIELHYNDTLYINFRRSLLCCQL